MATAQSVINRALRLCKVLATGEAAAAEDTEDAFSALNGLLAEWHEAEIGLPDYSFATTETELASDTADAEAIAYQLAIRIAPEYEHDLSPAILTSAAESMARLRL